MDANPTAAPAAPYVDLEALERKARSGARRIGRTTRVFVSDNESSVNPDPEDRS